MTEVRIAPGEPRSDKIDFIITILDVNDNSPAFSQNVYSVTRLESFPVDETIATVSCSDPDIIMNGTFDGYVITDVSPRQLVTLDTFSINNSTGNITLLKPLDFELYAMISINLLCFDNEGMQDRARVEIDLEDVNDNDPVVVTFFPDPIPVTDAKMLGYIVGQFQCNDSDSEENGNVTYSFGEPSPPFSIHPITGDVIITSSPILGSGVFLVNYSITLTCSDQGVPPRSNSTTLFLQLYKDDSTPPMINFASVLNGQATISEGAQVGETLLRVEATDSTSPGVLFELRSETSPRTFVIDPSSGLITLDKTLDREEVARYSFQVVVTEVLVGPFTEPATLTRASVAVAVLDVNDNRPQCSQGTDLVKYILVGSYSFNNSLEIADLTCTDLDNGRNGSVIFTSSNLPVVSDGVFDLNPTSGRITFTGVLSKNATYSMTINASDEGMPPLHTLINITVIVTGERREELTQLEQLLLIIVLSISGGLLLCAFVITMLMCCCRCYRKRKFESTYATVT